MNPKFKPNRDGKD